MSGFLLHDGAKVICVHNGEATPTTSNRRVTVSKQNTVLMPPPYKVVGCSLSPKAGGPCVSAKWITGTTRVRSNGHPLLMFNSKAICSPPGTPLKVVSTQKRVSAT